MQVVDTWHLPVSLLADSLWGTNRRLRFAPLLPRPSTKMSDVPLYKRLLPFLFADTPQVSAHTK